MVPVNTAVDPTPAELEEWFGLSPAVEPVDEVVLLPVAGSGRRADRTRRRHRWAFRHGATLAAVAMLAATVLAVANPLEGAGLPDGRAVLSAEAVSGETAGRPEGPNTALVAVTGADGELAAMAAVSAGGGVLLVPTGAMVEVPSFGLEPLRRAQVLGGAPLLRTTAERALGGRLDAHIAVTADDLEALFTDAPVTVSLTAPVAISSAGRVESLWPAGPVVVDGQLAARFLTDSLGAGELALLDRHQAFWAGWLGAVAAGEWAPPPGLSEAGWSLAELVARMAEGPRVVERLPVTHLTAGGEGSDLYRIEETAPAAVARALPGLGEGASRRTRVQLLNGTGEPGLGQRVTALLGRAPVEVVVTGNAEHFHHARTQVVYHEEADRALAEEVREALGVGELVLSRRSLDVVDVSVVIGADLRA